jgi:uncharacterized protein (DUF2236 family)
MSPLLKPVFSPRVPAPVRRQLRDWIVKILKRGHTDGDPIDYEHPIGDPGLFGPDTVTWRVHADFPGMMAGGICALMLQTLHPLALAGVWDHSNFREDLIGRLRRTTGFVAGTSYAPRAAAETLIARVRRIHDRVRGHMPDGTPYSANDPALLTWVHCTEMSSFLKGYEAYSGFRLTPEEEDRYYAETSQIAEALGAIDVPKTRAEVEDYFRNVQPQLEYSQRSREVLEVLGNVRLPIPAAPLARHLFLGSGAALLPAWAQLRLGRSRAHRLHDMTAAHALRGMAPVFRASLTEGVAASACRRMGIDIADLYR